MKKRFNARSKWEIRRGESARTRKMKKKLRGERRGRQKRRRADVTSGWLTRRHGSALRTQRTELVRYISPPLFVSLPSFSTPSSCASSDLVETKRMLRHFFSSCIPFSIHFINCTCEFFVPFADSTLCIRNSELFSVHSAASLVAMCCKDYGNTHGFRLLVLVRFSSGISQ